MKKYISVLLIVLTLGVFLITTLYAFFDTNTVSERENRELTSLPEFSFSAWKDGTFQEQMDAFLSDHVLGRNSFIRLANRIENTFRLSGKELILKDVTNENNENENEPEYIFLNDRIVSLYLHNDNNFLFYHESNEALFQAVPEGITKYFAVFPERAEYEAETITKHSDSAKADVDILYNYTSEDIHTIDMFQAIEDATKKHDLNELYFRTDHHWSALAAYYAANAFLEEAGKPAVSLSDYIEKTGPDFHGYLTAKHNMDDQIPGDPLHYYLRKDGVMPTQTLYWKDLNTGDIDPRKEVLIDPSRGGYYTFVEKSQFAYTVIDGTATDQSCLLMVSDSYGLTLATWLTQAYDTIVIVDPRYYDTIDTPFMDLFEKYKVTDFLSCTEEESMSINLYNTKMTENLLNTKE